MSVTLVDDELRACPATMQFPRGNEHLLDGKEMPVSTPVQSLNCRLQVEFDEASMCLRCVIQGDLLDVEEPDQLEAAGAVLGPASSRSRPTQRRLATQFVHGDSRSSNVLSVGPEVVAVIDFEEARLDHAASLANAR